MINMRVLSTEELLDVWEQGISLPPIERSLRLLSVACSESPETLAQLSVGQRDARLLMLRHQTFGAQLTSIVTCTVCGERLEMNFSTADLHAGDEDESLDASSLAVAGYKLCFRLPNSLDLIAIADCQDADAARRLLLERCLSTSEHNGEPVSAGVLPAEIVDALAQRMARADPQGDVQLYLDCPQCGHQWHACFDVGSFFWNEINAWAQRTLRNVHSLASVYGWRETDILNMSAWRRQFYLDCIGG
jgi:hypothetical protein